LEVLRGDNRAIFKAASQASKAADFLLAFVRENETALARLCGSITEDEARLEAAAAVRAQHVSELPPP
jgi:antirestriction protein ArdC